MNILLKSFCYIIFFIHVGLSSLAARKMADVHMDELYKKIGSELVSIQTMHPPCQPKVYVVLDQVDKMYNMIKTNYQSVDEIKKTLKHKELENADLKNEVVALRETLDATHSKLELSYKNLETEKQASAKLAEEKKSLMVEKKKKDEQITSVAKADQSPKDISPTDKALAELTELEKQHDVKS